MRGLLAVVDPLARPASLRSLASTRLASFPLAVWAVLALALLCGGCASRAAGPVRDRFPLDPREGLASASGGSVERGWLALEAGDLARARAEFERESAGPSRRAASIGIIETLVLDKRPADAAARCAEVLADGEGTVPLWTACGEAYAGSGEPIRAYELYDRAASRAPTRRGVAERAGELRAAATSAVLSSAEGAASAGRREQARARLGQALAWNPGDAEVLVRVAEVECSAGEKDSALRYYRDALALGGLDDASLRRAGDLALEMGDYSMAVTVFDSLATRDPGSRDRAAEARLAFRIDNWPDVERQAARARRLTRASAALLAWWMFPEVRDARVRSGIVASDVLERRDSRVMMRAVSLGLLDVDSETHRARPDAPLTRAAAAQLMLRLVPLLGGAGGAAGCLSAPAPSARAGPDAVRLATRCGLLSESGGAFVGGPEMTRGLDRLRSARALGEAASRD